MRRNSNRIKCVFNAVAAALAVAVVAGCSTTRRLPAGEVLYTGVKKVEISAPDGMEVPSDVADELKGRCSRKAEQSAVWFGVVPYAFPDRALGLQQLEQPS